jgi:integrase
LEEDVPGRKTPRAIISTHGLSHTAGSLTLLAGVPLTVVSAQLGHANPAITARIYAHLVNERDLDLAAAIFDTPPSAGAMGDAMGEARASV